MKFKRTITNEEAEASIRLADDMLRFLRDRVRSLPADAEVSEFAVTMLASAYQAAIEETVHMSLGGARHTGLEVWEALIAPQRETWAAAFDQRLLSLSEAMRAAKGAVKP